MNRDWGLLEKFLNNGCYLNSDGNLRISKKKIKEIEDNTKDCISYSDYLSKKLENCPNISN